MSTQFITNFSESAMDLVNRLIAIDFDRPLVLGDVVSDVGGAMYLVVDLPDPQASTDTATVVEETWFAANRPSSPVSPDINPGHIPLHKRVTVVDVKLKKNKDATYDISKLGNLQGFVQEDHVRLAVHI